MNQTNTTTPTDTDASPLAADDPRAIFARAVATTRTAMEGVRSDQLGLATPCDGYDAQRMLGHLVMVLERVACAGRGEDPMTWPPEPTELDGVDWVAALTAAAHEVQEVWTDDAVLARDIALPWTVMSGADTLAMYTNELTVHTWDVAQATGQSPAWDDAVLALSWEAIRRELPDADRGPMWEGFKVEMPEGIPFDPPFANAVDVADDAPMIDRLVAWNGRQP